VAAPEAPSDSALRLTHANAMAAYRIAPTKSPRPRQFDGAPVGGRDSCGVGAGQKVSTPGVPGSDVQVVVQLWKERPLEEKLSGRPSLAT
jgi:hypothetical protein